METAPAALQVLGTLSESGFKSKPQLQPAAAGGKAGSDPPTGELSFGALLWGALVMGWPEGIAGRQAAPGGLHGDQTQTAAPGAPPGPAGWPPGSSPGPLKPAGQQQPETEVAASQGQADALLRAIARPALAAPQALTDAKGPAVAAPGQASAAGQAAVSGPAEGAGAGELAKLGDGTTESARPDGVVIGAEKSSGAMVAEQVARLLRWGAAWRAAPAGAEQKQGGMAAAGDRPANSQDSVPAPGLDQPAVAGAHAAALGAGGSEVGPAVLPDSKGAPAAVQARAALAPAPSGGSVLPAASEGLGSAAAAPPLEIRAQVLQQLLQMGLPDRPTGAGGERVTLQLDPPQLGKVEVQVQAKADHLTVVFKAEHPEVEAALRENVKELVESIVSRGGRWVEVNVRWERPEFGPRADQRPDPYDRPDRSPGHSSGQRRQQQQKQQQPQQ
jgi:flagellar hook-length control protein FliK